MACKPSSNVLLSEDCPRLSSSFEVVGTGVRATTRKIVVAKPLLPFNKIESLISLLSASFMTTDYNLQLEDDHFARFTLLVCVLQTILMPKLGLFNQQFGRNLVWPEFPLMANT